MLVCVDVFIYTQIHTFKCIFICYSKLRTQRYSLLFVHHFTLLQLKEAATENYNAVYIENVIQSGKKKVINKYLVCCRDTFLKEKISNKAKKFNKGRYVRYFLLQKRFVMHDGIQCISYIGSLSRFIVLFKFIRLNNGFIFFFFFYARNFLT